MKAVKFSSHVGSDNVRFLSHLRIIKSVEEIFDNITMIVLPFYCDVCKALRFQNYRLLEVKF